MTKLNSPGDRTTHADHTVTTEEESVEPRTGARLEAAMRDAMPRRAAAIATSCHSTPRRNDD
ncbi:MAG: hypothetical protein U1E20_02325 [Methylocystis sp.]|uniref:hypothetical protein n=1 Tax=Methylocystis sp. TaxID=1911079 RepID=UPI00392C1FA9